MKLAESLLLQRKQMHFSQEELAEKCQVSRQAIAKWESGESVPTIDKLIFLADLYELSLDELVGRVVKDDYVRFTEFVKKFVPPEIRFGEDDDVSAIIARYFTFVDSLNLSAEEKLRGLDEIFLTGINID